MKDSLGDRQKNFYEQRSRTFLPRRTYTIIRIDGKAFHTYTKGLKRPFDLGFINDMNETAKYLCKNIQGAKFAFVQSDEISILLTDFEKLQTDAWFDGNVQKMVSVSASMAASKFNQLRLIRVAESYTSDMLSSLAESVWTAKRVDSSAIRHTPLADFDSRVFTIPSKTEVENYFIWRQNDTVRNSISSLAQSMYSHEELKGVNTSEMQELCFQKGTNWNDLDPKLKRGRLIVKEEYVVGEGESSATRTRWVSVAPPTFTQHRRRLDYLIPAMD